MELESTLTQMIKKRERTKKEISDLKTKQKEQEKDFADLEQEKIHSDEQIEKGQAMEAAGKVSILREENKIVSKNLEIQALDRTYGEHEDKITSLMTSITEIGNKMLEAEASAHQVQDMKDRLEKEKERCLNKIRLLQEQTSSLKEKKKLMAQQQHKLLYILREFPRNEKKLVAKRDEMTEEVVQLQKKLLQERAVTAINKNLAEKLLTEYTIAQTRERDLRTERDELNLLTALRQKERQSLKDQVMTFTKRKSQLEIEVNIINNNVEATMQEHINKQKQLKFWEKEYELMREDRSRVLRQVLLTKQKALEWEEKVHVVANEKKNLEAMKDQKNR